MGFGGFVVEFLYFAFFPVCLIYSLWAYGSWCCPCPEWSGMTFGNWLHHFHFRSLFVTCQAANTALQVLSEEEYLLISVICYWPSPIGPVPSPCWLLLLLYSCLSGFWTCKPAPWKLGALPASYTSYYFSLAGRKNYIVIQWHLDEMHLMDGQAVKYLKEM